MGLREELSPVEWGALSAMVAGLVLLASFGPSPGNELSYDDLQAAFANTPFVAYASVAGAAVIGWLAVLVLPALRRIRPAFDSRAVSFISSFT